MRDLLKRHKKPSEPLWAEGELKELAVNFESVSEWLLGLSETDYAKVLQVIGIQRKANDETAKILGGKFAPTTFIDDNLESVSSDVNHVNPKSEAKA